MQETDLSWLDSAQKGDPDAFTQLVEAFQQPVFNLCYRMLGDAAEAEDAAQETFMRVYRSIKRYDNSRPFPTWLMSIAAHYCIDQQRRRRIPLVEMDDFLAEIIADPAPDPERSLARSQEDDKLHQLLNTLNPQDRAAVVLRYWHDYSDEEIANSLSLSVSAVKSRLHRARLALAKRWNNDDDVPVAERNQYVSRII